MEGKMSADEKVSYSSTEDNVVIEPAEEIDSEEFDNGFFAQMKRLPRQSWVILFVEFAERSSYYGIKAILVLYLLKSLGFKYEKSMAVYHSFSFLSSFTGILGAVMADSWVGNFKTIVTSLVIYSVGEVIMSLTTIPTFGHDSPIGPLVGLFISGIAAGNIKPCVAAFGGEQMNKRDTTLIEKFFTLFYMSVNVGAMWAMIFMPIMRTTIQCYGRDCYPSVFGLNCALVILATVSIIFVGPWCTQKEPEGNVMIRFVKIITHALSQKRKNTGEKYKHWIYYAQDKYGESEVEDAKACIKVIVMMLPLPVFWALFNQQGSTWTLQAEQMSGDMGSMGTLRAEQNQFFNPILVLIFAPFFESVVYPLFERCNMPLTPLKKMTIGMFLAALSFGISAFVQMRIQAVHPLPSPPSQITTSVDFINVSPCGVIEVSPDTFLGFNLTYGMNSRYKIGQAGKTKFLFRALNCFSENDSISKILELNFHPNTYQSLLVNLDRKGIQVKELRHVFPDVDIQTSNTRVRTIYIPHANMTETVSLTYHNILQADKSIKIDNFTSYNGTVDEILADRYTFKVIGSNEEEYEVEAPKNGFLFGTFGAYTIVLSQPQRGLSQKKLVAHIFEDVQSTSVHRVWQIPQYAAVSAGEVMFAVTGLQFAYSQAPNSMKSVLQSIWVLTTAFGDAIVVILSVANPVEGVDKQMILYGAVMIVVAMLFTVMSHFYKYKDFSGKTATKVTPADELGDEITVHKSESTTHL